MNLAKLSGSIGACAEIAAKFAIVALFSLGAVQKVLAIALLLHQQSAIQPVTWWIALATHVSALAFILLIIVMTIMRHQPVQRAAGFEARVSALAGTFLAGTLALLPPAEIPLTVALIAMAMSALGAMLSACVLLWLGRSFSITAQARTLVTSGPYAFIRHPLYLTEEFMVLGMMLLVWSPLAGLIVGIHWAFQLRRMACEEKVLEAVYPEYAVYAGRTPRIILRRRFIRSAAAL